jgi:hypothetical protein
MPGSVADAPYFHRFKHTLSTGGATLCDMILLDELAAEPATDGLARLACLVAARKLTPLLGMEAPWTEVGLLSDTSWIAASRVR